MNQRIIRQTVLILLDKKLVKDNAHIKTRLRNSRFFTNESSDIFGVLEDISDFTVRTCPDVVLLEVGSLKKDFSLIRKLMRTFAGKCDFPIFALTKSANFINDKECFEGNLAELEARLEKVFPLAAHAASGA